MQEPVVIQDRYSFHPGQTEVQVYTADTVTYADLDPKAFMRDLKKLCKPLVPAVPAKMLALLSS